MEEEGNKLSRLSHRRDQTGLILITKKEKKILKENKKK